MKILIITHYFYPHIGGIEIVAYNHAKELTKAGNEVTIVTSRLSSEKEVSFIDKINIKRVKALNPFEKKFHVPYPLFLPKLAAVLINEIRKTDLVVLHGTIYLSSFFGAIIAKFYKKPVILMEHVGFVKYKSSILNFIQKLLYLSVGKTVINLSNKIYALNPDVKKYISGITNLPVSLFKNGVDTKMFHPVNTKIQTELRKKYNLPVNRKLVLFVGRFVQKKGLDLVLKSKEQSFDLVLVGSGVIDSAITDKGIHIFRDLAQSKVAEIYQACDLFVLPSRSEGFPLSILEAMASGLPIITTGGIYLDSVDKRLVKIISPEVNEIKNTIINIFSNSNLLRKMQNYSRETAVSEFDWKESVSILKI
jgi:D-inositol-3-phosphate glycosyltransferase